MFSFYKIHITYLIDYFSILAESEIYIYRISFFKFVEYWLHSLNAIHLHGFSGFCLNLHMFYEN